MPTPVTAPLAQPPVYGLVAAAEVVDDPGLAWELGTEWESEACQLGGVVPIVCAGNSVEMVAEEGPSHIEEAPTPFAVFAVDECSALTRGRGWEGRVRRRLEATRSFLVARELWDGALAVDADDAASTYLAAPGTADVLTAAPASPVAALACVEHGLAGSLFGARGMVHVPAGLLAHLASENVARLDGTVWRTPGGHTLIPDAGYSGNGPSVAGTPPTPDPAGASQWIYGTAPVRLRLGQIEVLSPETAPLSTIDWRVNTITAWAVQPVLAEWDTCATVAAEVNVAVCTGA